ncbi:MAG: cold shock domain-containing protein [Lachnospiraceae bacterium]|nr:cold shock domain-containing protein [Lachnospiraceae bacterium]
MYGKITKYFHDRKFGFIRGEDGNTYFIHHSKLNGEYIDSGCYVFFKPFQNDRSDYNAKSIMVIEASERKTRNGNTRK